MKQFLRLFMTYCFADSYQIFFCHIFRDGLVRFTGKSNISVCNNANKPARRFRYGNTGNFMFRHQVEGIGKFIILRNLNRVNDHAGLKFLYLANFSGLFSRCHITMQNTKPPGLSHRNSKLRLRYRIHSSRQQRNTQRYCFCQFCVCVGLRRQDVRSRRAEQDIVKCEGFLKVFYVFAHCQHPVMTIFKSSLSLGKCS